MDIKIILNLISTFFKLILIFVTKWLKGQMEERVRYHKKITLILDLIKKATDDKSEIINEKDFISNLDWEKKTRYEKYKSNIIDVLNKGGGFSDLLEVTDLGMNLRLKTKEKEVFEVLTDIITNEEKTVKIAQILSSY